MKLISDLVESELIATKILLAKRAKHMISMTTSHGGSVFFSLSMGCLWTFSGWSFALFGRFQVGSFLHPRLGYPELDAARTLKSSIAVQCVLAMCFNSIFGDLSLSHISFARYLMCLGKR